MGSQSYTLIAVEAHVVVGYCEAVLRVIARECRKILHLNSTIDFRISLGSISVEDKRGKIVACLWFLMQSLLGVRNHLVNEDGNERPYIISNHCSSPQTIGPCNSISST